MAFEANTWRTKAPIDERFIIPTAWYPYRLAISPDGRRIACINFKGFGNGPNAGKEIPKSDFLGMRGVISILAAREAMSSPILPAFVGRVSQQIKYVVFITKANHSYHAIFDRCPARHDPSLLRWGWHQTIKKDGQPTF